MNTRVGELRVVVLTNPHPRSDHPAVYQFIKTLMPLSQKLWVITGALPETAFEDSGTCVEIKDVPFTAAGNPLLLRLFKHGVANFRILINFIKIVGQADTVAFFYAFEQLIPMLLAKLLKKRTIVVMTSESCKNSAIIHKQTLFGLGGSMFPYFIKALERASCALSDCIVVFSRTYVELYDLQPYAHKVHEAGLYVDTEQFRETRSIADRMNVVGYIGRLSETKGVQNLPRAFELLTEKRSDLSFLIGGDGLLMPQIAQEIRERNLSISLPGWIPNAMLSEQLNELLLLVLPSYCGEGLPVILLEAMACGTPVLATPVAQVPFLVQDGETGFILHDNSPQSIAEKVLQVLANPNLETVAKNGQRFVQENHDYWPTVEKYRWILEATIGKDG